MPALTTEWLRHLVPLSGRVAKALVVDLDDTLWGGIVGEVGPEGVDLDPESVSGAGYLGLQRSLVDLEARGVLLAVCSKNNHDDALAVLARHPSMLVRPDDFAAMRINWSPKVENLRSIADELNIGLDAVAFLDDNPAECDQVRRLLPEVTVIELHSPPTATANPIAGHPAFERLGLSAEDRRRTELYAEQRSREELRTTTTSLDDYLRALGTTVEIAAMGPDDIERVSQLTQKTNQCNVTTRRYTVAEVERMADRPGREVLVVRAADRFGDHGVIGVGITDHSGEVAEIDTLLLSCRVIGRGVETAMLAAMVTPRPRSRRIGHRRTLPRHGEECASRGPLRRPRVRQRGRRPDAMATRPGHRHGVGPPVDRLHHPYRRGRPMSDDITDRVLDLASGVFDVAPRRARPPEHRGRRRGGGTRWLSSRCS